MIAVDTNILVYAHREDSPWHPSGRAPGCGNWPRAAPCGPSPGRVCMNFWPSSPIRVFMRPRPPWTWRWTRWTPGWSRRALIGPGGIRALLAGAAPGPHRGAGGRPPGARRPGGGPVPLARRPGTMDRRPGLQPLPRPEGHKPLGGLSSRRL
jgi:hypothetical protein